MPLHERVLLLCVMSSVVVLGTLVALSDSVDDDASSFVTWGAGLAVWSWAVLQAASSHVALRGDELVFVDVVVERTVRAQDIATVLREDGVGVRLTSGAEVTSLACAPAPLPVFGTQHLWDAARWIDEWRQGLPNESPATSGRPVVRWRLHRSAGPSLVAALAPCVG